MSRLFQLMSRHLCIDLQYNIFMHHNTETNIRVIKCSLNFRKQKKKSVDNFIVKIYLQVKFLGNYSI